jgi:tRNA/rRNA methyltransferase
LKTGDLISLSNQQSASRFKRWATIPLYNCRLLTSSKQDCLRVVLVATRNPLNIGAAARAMSNFGFRHLRVVNPYEAAFREARSAVGASELLATAEEFSSVRDAVADCSLVVGTTAAHNREMQHALRQLDEGGRLIAKRLGRVRVALLFGSEKRGLSNHDLSHCHWLLHIPTTPDHVSMNLGQAVAVCLYELARELGKPELKKQSTAVRKRAGTEELRAVATAGELERITEVLLDGLRASGYLRLKPSAAVEDKLRRQVRRLSLSAADAEVWLGMLRQMVWKMRAEEKSPKQSG